jgi:BirA family biotin operon repressor/biotin-[acetyl-CoA-carboxylase] ligase
LSFIKIDLDEIDSTQIYLINKIKNSKDKNLNYFVSAKNQTNGIGSRNNKWQEIKNSVYLSFSLNISDLPDDLKLHSVSLYFATVVKNVFSEINSKVWIKWPNDFYIENNKIGGIMSNISQNKLICGIGLNLKSSEQYGSLDLDISRDEVLDLIYKKLSQKFKSWNYIFSIYSLDFDKSRKFSVSIDGKKTSMENAKLSNDGSIFLNGERIYNNR